MNAAHNNLKSTAISTISAADQVRERFDSLTPRQREVCRLMVQGMMSKQIADQLQTSINTIKTHRNEIFRKMNAGSLVDLVHKVELLDRLPVGQAAPPPPDQPRRLLQVLVVEDHPVLRDTMTDALERLGYGVFAVENGSELDSILGAQHFDVVLLDIALGEGQEDGLSLAARLRQRSRCGIVMTTARGDREARIQGYAGGADAYLVKPIDFQELDAILQNLSRRLAAG